VLTGLLRTVSPDIVQAVPGANIAAFDPQFAGMGYESDLGYLSAGSSARSATFYEGTIDPAVIAYDETHKDVIAIGNAATFPTVFLPPLLNKSSHITADVLLVVGQLDEVF